MAVPIFVWNGTAWESTGPTIPANPIKYQASAPSSPSTGDIWVDSDGDVTTGSQQFQRFRFVASGGETTISGADANGAVLAYTAGLEQVVLNGAVLVRGHDYTATTGTTITGLSPALVASDVLEVFSFIAFTVANTYTQSQVDGLITDAVGMKLIVPTSATNGTVGASGTVTFSGVSSVTINGAFTSTYEDYKLVLKITAATAATDLLAQLTSSGTPLSTSTYDAAYMAKQLGAGAFASAANTSASSWIFSGVANSSTNAAYGTYDISNPFASKYKSFIGNETRQDGYVWINGGRVQTSTSSYDGIKFFVASGTISGTIRIYGYKN